MQATEIAIEKKTGNKRGDGPLPGLGRLAKGVEQLGKELAKDVERLGGEVAKVREDARASEVKRRDDDTRLVKLVRVGFAGKFEGTVKNHPAYSQDDLAFFRTYGFNV